MPETENGASQSVVVVLTANEVRFIRECMLGCPVQTNVTNMLTLLGLVQGILKKLAPLAAADATPPVAPAATPPLAAPAGEPTAAPEGVRPDAQSRKHHVRGHT